MIRSQLTIARGLLLFHNVEIPSWIMNAYFDTTLLTLRANRSLVRVQGYQFTGVSLIVSGINGMHINHIPFLKSNWVSLNLEVRFVETGVEGLLDGILAFKLRRRWRIFFGLLNSLSVSINPSVYFRELCFAKEFFVV